MKRGLQGRLLSQGSSPEPFKSFVPKPLPPAPAIEFSPELLDLMERSNLALGRLDGLARLLPDLQLFLYFYIRKEAVLSSQIEGTQSSLSELLLFESKQLSGVPTDDVVEVSNYVSALQFGLKKLRQDFPISIRLIKKMHRVLLAKGRGQTKDPGEFRASQNWIGGSRPGNAVYVPPPKEEVVPLMGQIETFYHEHKALPTLMKAALIHVQFETIHPFLDGNGRLGRLLITLMLVADAVLAEPLLYLSLYFKKHRTTYYDLLQKVRFEGDWEEWLNFFLTAVLETAQQAVTTSHEVLRLFQRDRARIEKLGRVRGSTILVHGLLQKKPYLTIPTASKDLRLSQPAVTNAMRALQKLEMVRESSGRSWNRIFVYSKYLRIMTEGAELSAE
jgi:cell filamentation protein, protein adenylyltransferase